jgi:hypothetical protein
MAEQLEVAVKTGRSDVVKSFVSTLQECRLSFTFNVSLITYLQSFCVQLQIAWPLTNISVIRFHCPFMHKLIVTKGHPPQGRVHVRLSMANAITFYLLSVYILLDQCDRFGFSTGRTFSHPLTFGALHWTLH